MERFIDQLGKQALPETQGVIPVVEQAERLRPSNPVVISSVTMGKELHAGHMLLIGVCELVRGSLESTNPTILINNNTGPRAAGALVNIAAGRDVSLPEAGRMLAECEIDTPEIVAAYRARNVGASDIDQALDLLSTGKYDIFACIASSTTEILRRSGFHTEIVPESSLIGQATNSSESLFPEWSGSGFLPFSDGSRLAILEKNGKRTATGALLESTRALTERSGADLVLAVDSMPDTADLAFVFTNSDPSKACIQIPGAGVGFNGRIASGSAGEALTIDQILQQFEERRPIGTLKNAIVYMILNKPLSLPRGTKSLADSFYDFADNEAIIDMLIRCDSEASQFDIEIARKVEALRGKVGHTTVTIGRSAQNLIQFLQQKSKSLLDNSNERIISTSKRIEPVTSYRDLEFRREFGYQGSQTQDQSDRFYAIRRNFYFDSLRYLLEGVGGIQSLKSSEFDTVNQMIQFCRERIGL